MVVDTPVVQLSLVGRMDMRNSIHCCMDCEVGVVPSRMIFELQRVEKQVAPELDVTVEVDVIVEEVLAEPLWDGRRKSRPVLQILMAVIATWASSHSHSPPHLFVVNPAACERLNLHQANCWNDAVGGDRTPVMRPDIDTTGSALVRHAGFVLHPHFACGVHPPLASRCLHPDSSGRAVAAWCRLALAQFYMCSK